MQENGLCEGDFLVSSALQAPCTNIDEIEATWDASQD